MKKLISFILISAVLVGAVFAVVSKKNYPEAIVYNYMETSAISRTFISTDDYVAVWSSSKKQIYDKKNGKTKDFAQTVFDKYDMGFKFLCAKGNLLYYMAKDEKTGGSAIFEYNLDTLDLRKVDTKNSISSLAAFLGTDTVLGIEQGGYDVMSTLMSPVWMNKRGRLDRNTVQALLTEKDTENKFGISEISKICTTDDYIFFVNELSTLYKFGYEDGSFKKLSEDRVTDFFITEDKVYFYSADSGDSLYMTDYDGNTKQKVTDEKFVEVRPKNGKAYAKREDGRLFVLDGANSRKTKVKLIDLMWDTDGKFVYEFNLEKNRFEKYEL